jgi:hypothetical protein
MTRTAVQRRLKAILRGAFSGPPTPLKDIPKKSGESRSNRRKLPSSKMGGSDAKKDDKS